jgi:hypothetical protein
VVEHHLVVFATNTGLLVAAKCGMRRIGTITIRPYETSELDISQPRIIEVHRPRASPPWISISTEADQECAPTQMFRQRYIPTDISLVAFPSMVPNLGRA